MNSPSDCQKVMVFKPNNTGMSQFHNHIRGNPMRRPIMQRSTTNPKNPTTPIPTFSKKLE